MLILSPGGFKGPSLALDFMLPNALDPRIAFSRASTGTYFDAAGVMRTAATNAPRWDYDPATHQLRGLLIEEQRTNIALTSTPIGADWGQSNATVTAASGVAPDGTNTMVRVAETATSGFHMNYSVVTLAASTVYTASVFAKAAQNRYLQLMFDNGASSQLFATFDLQTGVVSGPLTAAGGAVVGAASIQDVGNIYRCVISGNLGAFTIGRIFTTLSNVANPGPLPSYAGNSANGLSVWGAQVEQGGFATSHIPTTSVAVTRAIDTCYIPTNASWFSPGASSLLFECDVPIVNCTYGGISDAAFGSNTSYFNNSFFVHGASAGGSPLVANAINKMCGVIVPNTAVKVCNNGGSTNTSAMSSPGQPGATRLAIGNDPWSLSSAINGHVRRVNYWPRALSDAELQQVTT